MNPCTSHCSQCFFPPRYPLVKWQMMINAWCLMTDAGSIVVNRFVVFALVSFHVLIECPFRGWLVARDAENCKDWRRLRPVRKFRWCDTPIEPYTGCSMLILTLPCYSYTSRKKLQVGYDDSWNQLLLFHTGSKLLQVFSSNQEMTKTTENLVQSQGLHRWATLRFGTALRGFGELQKLDSSLEAIGWIVDSGKKDGVTCLPLGCPTLEVGFINGSRTPVGNDNPNEFPHS